MTQEATASYKVRAQICKIDDEKRRVFGFALTATDAEGKEVVDHQGDILSVEELEEASFDYVASSRDVGAMHEGGSIGHLICAVPLTPEIRKAMGVEPGPAALFVGHQITNDAAWGEVKKRGLREFSIDGEAYREAVK